MRRAVSLVALAATVALSVIGVVALAASRVPQLVDRVATQNARGPEPGGPVAPDRPHHPIPDRFVVTGTHASEPPVAADSPEADDAVAPTNPEPEVAVATWTMVDVSTGGVQGDAHLIRGGGRVVLLDAGMEDAARERLVPLLSHEGVGRIDTLIVSHAHRDHYGGIRPILEAGVEVGEVWFGVPDDEACDREVPWGCDREEIAAYRQMIADRGVPLVDPVAGAELELGGARLRVVHAFDGRDTPVGPTDVNDTSLIMVLEAGRVSVLFTGDLNEALGGWLADHPIPLPGTRLLKVPHHGATNIAPNAFFDAVDAHLAFVPTPTEVWCSERGERARTWLQVAGIPTYVNGLHGHVTVSMGPGDRVEVTTETEGAGCERPAG